MEYGLILALVSVVAVGSLGGVGGKVSDTFKGINYTLDGGTYSEVEVDQKIADGYIPLSSADDLMMVSGASLPKAVNTFSALDESYIFGEGTRWEGEYTEKGLGGKYIQVEDIDLSGIDNFSPIGIGVGTAVETHVVNGSTPFTGVFDGGGYDISNLTINDGEYYRGLFGQAVGAKLKNINIVNADIVGGRRTGGLVGHTFNTQVTNSTSSGKVSGRHDTGGLVGCNMGSGSLIHKSSSSAKVHGLSEDNIGGLAGWTGYGGKVYESYATGDVLGSTEVGGLVGDMSLNGEIYDSYATGKVSSPGFRGCYVQVYMVRLVQ